MKIKQIKFFISKIFPNFIDVNKQHYLMTSQVRYNAVGKADKLLIQKSILYYYVRNFKLFQQLVGFFALKVRNYYTNEESSLHVDYDYDLSSMETSNTDYGLDICCA